MSNQVSRPSGRDRREAAGWGSQRRPSPSPAPGASRLSLPSRPPNGEGITP